MMFLKNVYDAKIKDIEDKTPSFTNLATNADLNPKINEVKDEIPSISYSATTVAFTAVKNKIQDVNTLIKKADYDRKRNILLLLIIMNSRIMYLMQKPWQQKQN